MNKELKKAIYRLNLHKEGAGLQNGTCVVNVADIETVLNYIDNSISKDAIEKKIDKFKNETVWGYNDWKYDEKVYQSELNIIDKIKEELLEGK